MAGLLNNRVQIFFLFLSCSIIFNFGALTETYYFDDDIGRAAVGYGYYNLRGFGEYADTGRPVAEIVIRLLSGWFGRPTDVIALDVHPLTKIISVMCLAFAGWVVYTSIMKKQTWSALFVSLAVVFSPYYIACIQYRFDSATMGMALFFSTLPFCPGCRRPYICHFVCYLVSLNLYQSFMTVPVLLIMVIFLQDYFFDKITKKDNIYPLLFSLVAIFSAFVCYKIVFAMLPSRDYTTIHSKFIPMSYYGWVVFKINLMKLLEIFFLPYKGAAGVVLVGLILLSSLGVVSNAYQKKRHVLKDSLLYLFASVLILIAALLPFSLLYSPVVMARTLAGAQFVLVLWLLPISWLSSWFLRIIMSAFILLYILLCALNAAITNAIRAQYDYEVRLFGEILESSESGYLPSTIYINDKEAFFAKPWLRSVKNTLQNYPFTRHILHNTYMMNNLVWAERQAQLYNAEVQMKYLYMQKEWTLNEICRWPLKIITHEYNLYGMKDIRVVDMTKASCPK